MKFNKTFRQICLSLFLLVYFIPSLVVLTEENLTSLDYVKKGLSEMAQSNNEQALEYYNKAINLDQNCGDAYYGKALIELKLENKGNALKLLIRQKKYFLKKIIQK